MNVIIVNWYYSCNNVGMANDDRVRVNLALPEDTRPFFDEIKKKTGFDPVDFVRLVFNMKASEVAEMLKVKAKLPQEDGAETTK